MSKNRSILGSIGITVGGLSLSEINTILGFVSLVIGISYQIWKWRRAYTAIKS